MPSGAKKRKAAKKKMVQQINPNSSSPSHGDDDVQHYDEKESDGGSPASQEHHSSVHPFAEGDEKEVKEREDNSSAQLITEKKLMEGGSTDANVQDVGTEEGIVQIEWELKSEEDNESQEISVESKEVNTGGSSRSSSSSSSSSSSDDESRVVEKKTEVVETYLTVDSVKPVGSLAGTADHVDNNISVAETTNGIASVVLPDEALLIEDVVEVNKSAPTGYSEHSSLAYKLDSDKKLPSSDEITGFSPVLMDPGSSKKDDEVVSASEEKPAAFVDAKDSTTEDKEELVQSFNAPDVHTSCITDNIVDSENPEFSGSKPLVISPPQAAQKTFLKSCCGIFELFTSSDR